MAIKGLILSCDGTLAETADVRRSAYNQAFAEAGLDWVWGRALFAQILSSALPGTEVEFFARFRYPDRAQKMEASGLSKQLEARQTRIYLNMLEAGAAPLRPGIARLMAEVIASNIRVFICSTGTREEFETLLFNQFGLEMIDAIWGSVAADDAIGTTPVALLRRAKGELGVLPQDTMAICSQPQGAVAAAGLGMTVLATPTFYTRQQNFSGAHVVLSDLGHPSAPCTILYGEAPKDAYVTLQSLEFWHRKCRGLMAHAA